ncbi:hypothetical protein MNBD_GAMMA08-1472 [hydrothermal vent metagenome]|uniref:Uncharacterized protein n=1 Tax=hydrothermal vent metagenome TaxID=652676 RepID=A0A3B0WRR9_9ZZZZ
MKDNIMQIIYNNSLVIYLAKIWWKISIRFFGLYPSLNIQNPVMIFHRCNDIGLENYIQISSSTDYCKPFERLFSCEYKTNHGDVFLLFLLKDNEIEIVEYMVAYINPHQYPQSGNITDDDVLYFNSIIKTNYTFKKKLLKFVSHCKKQ